MSNPTPASLHCPECGCGIVLKARKVAPQRRWVQHIRSVTRPDGLVVHYAKWVLSSRDW